jgi:pyruvate,water dikinase
MTNVAVNGWVYNRMSGLGAGPDAPEGDELIAEIGRRNERAEAVLAGRLWRDVLDRWDKELKPASIQAHLRLARVDLEQLSDAQLGAHIATCFEHSRAMAYQHHRFNTSAMIPLGDFCVHVAEWIGADLAEILSLFEGCSPISGVWCDEIAPAARAVMADPEALALLEGSSPPAARLVALRARLSEVDEWAVLAGCRVIDGFDLTAPTMSEAPGLMLSKLAAAVAQGRPQPTARADAAVAAMRARVPEEHREAFDDLYGEARLMYRLRDERGVHSDICSTGLTRLAVLELGRRLADRSVVDVPDHLFEAGVEELLGLADGASSPDADELRTRAKARAASALLDPPLVLGPPASPPPPLDAFAPALGRVVTAMRLVGAEIGGAEVEQPAAGGVIAGLAGSPGTYTGRARVIQEFADLHLLEPGDVLVAMTTTEACNSAIHLVGAIVTDHGGRTAHPAIVAREMGIPAVVNTKVATREIPDGATVTVDGTAGTVTLRT